MSLVPIQNPKEVLEEFVDMQIMHNNDCHTVEIRIE